MERRRNMSWRSDSECFVLQEKGSCEGQIVFCLKAMKNLLLIKCECWAFFLHMWIYTDCVYFFLMSKLQGRICLIIPRIGSLFCNLDLNWEQLLFFLINNFSFFFFLINNFLSMGKACECIGQVWLLVKKMVIELMNLVKYIFLFSYRLGTGSALSPLTVLTLHPSHSLSTLRAYRLGFALTTVHRVPRWRSWESHDSTSTQSDDTDSGSSLLSHTPHTDECLLHCIEEQETRE